MASHQLLFPPIYLLSTHIPLEQLHELEDQIPSLTYDLKEARLVLGKVGTKQRALLELRSRHVYTEEVAPGDAVKPSSQVRSSARQKLVDEPPRKKRRVATKATEVITIDSSTESENGSATPRRKFNQSFRASQESTQSQGRSPTPEQVMSSPVEPETQSSVATTVGEKQGPIWEEGNIKVVKLSWFTESVAAGELLPLDSYLVYEGTIVNKPRLTPVAKKPLAKSQDSKEILARAKADAPKTVSAPFTHGRYHKHDTHSQESQSSITRPTHLLHQTTSEHDNPVKLPPLPEFLNNTYSCCRPTPLTCPNDPFLAQLKQIKLYRTLTQDQIGVRAYSTAIASLAAYPHLLSSPVEVSRLPGCDHKIAILYQEWAETGRIAYVESILADEKFQVLNLFYEIWGCAAATANEFYRKGYRDLDDIVMHEWSALSRVQQIGVKFYEEFQCRIPRSEVKAIADTILKHTNKLHPGFQMCIVGGYRRGKTESGDVDVVLTHPDENVTNGVIDDIVTRLETAGWVTHTLLLTRTNSERGQQPVGWKGDMKKPGTGFDTLDKALLVWQDPEWPSKEADVAAATEAATKVKNPNVHRRVDIIISPWKTAGCAIAGWTSGTTFQRDLRRWAKTKRNMKFDSSGIRSHIDGSWIDLEGARDGNDEEMGDGNGGKGDGDSTSAYTAAESQDGDYDGSVFQLPRQEETLDLLEKEKRVFRGLGLEWREPGERCTG